MALRRVQPALVLVLLYSTGVSLVGQQPVSFDAASVKRNVSGARSLPGDPLGAQLKSQSPQFTQFRRWRLAVVPGRNECADAVAFAALERETVVGFR